MLALEASTLYHVQTSHSSLPCHGFSSLCSWLCFLSKGFMTRTECGGTCL